MQKQPEPTPSPCREHPVGQNPHREKQSLHQRRNVRGGYTRSAMGGKGGTVTGMDRGGNWRLPLTPSFFSSFLLHLGSSHPGVLGTSPCTTLPDPISQALPPHLPSCPAPQDARGEVQKRVYAAQRTKLGRPRPEAVTVGGSWGDRTPDPLGAHICMGNPG